jgi:hypothetical protein
MPTLTCRREKDRHQESWRIYFGDVQVGWIGERAGVPKGVDQWGWSCGFHPGSDVRDHARGTAATFDQARADFEAAWRIFLPKCTEEGFQEWRRQQASTAWKYAMWEAGCRMPTQMVDGRAVFAASPSNVKSSSAHVYACHMNVTNSEVCD